MKRKQVVLFSLFCLMSIAFFGQRERVEYLPTFDERKIHYGFYLGLNQNDFKITLNDTNLTPDANITVTTTTGFNVGLITDLRLHKNINLRFEPGLMTNTKNILFNHLETPVDSLREVSSTFLRIPLLLKFSTDRYQNVKPYVLGGFSYNYNFSSNENNKDDNAAGQFRTTTSNFMYEVGFGIDIYLYYFKFSPSIRGIFAFNNEVKYDNDPNSNWTAPINYMGTRGVFLTFSFE